MTNNPLPETGLVRLAQIIGDPKANPPIPPIIPVSKASWWNGVKSGKYPTPVKLTQVATFTDSEDEIEATGEDKESDLEFETGSRHGMDMLGQQAFNQASGGFHRLTGGRYQVGQCGVQWAFGVFLPQGNEVQACFPQEVFVAVIVVGFVTGDRRILWEIKGVLFQSLRIAIGTGGQKEFHRVALGSDYEMNFQAIEIAPLARLIAPPRFALIASAPPNADIIASRQRDAVDDVETLSIQLMTQTRQAVK